MKRFRHIAKTGVLVWMTALLVVSTFIPTRQAAAQFSIPGLEAVEGAERVADVQKDVQDAIEEPIAVALIQILLNLISFVANRLAYDAAIALSSGGAGQSPLAEYRDAKEYFEDLGQDIAAEHISALSQGLDEIGINFDVCAPSDPVTLQAIQLGIASAYDRPEPEARCELRNIRDNWEAYIAQKGQERTPEALFNELASGFAPGQTDLSATIEIYSQVYGQIAQDANIETQELIADDGFQDVENIITGNVETPASVLQNRFNQTLNKAQDNQGEALQQALFSNEGALLQIGVSAGSVFLNTLLSELTNKVYTGLFETNNGGGGVFNPEFIGLGGRARARETFKDLLTAPIQTLDQYNVVNQFVACPGSNRGPNNCVMDTSFAAAIARAEAGRPLTVQEAIDANLLNGNWPLIPESDSARNQDPFCYTGAYCHGNLVKMRIARILPAGWELAANSPANNGSITLQEIVDGFNDCDPDPANESINAQYPWCHLIDPNWILKYPDTMCRAQTFGQTLAVSNADVRSEVCVDTPSCIAEDANGNCIGGYGYCTRERNTWRFDGDSCPAQFATCTTLTSRAGDTNSFLTNTADFGECDASNAGCRWYQFDKLLDTQDNTDPADDEYTFASGTCSISGDACVVDGDCGIGESCVASSVVDNRIYLDAEAQQCDPASDGCTELFRAATSTFNGVRNPSFEVNADNGPAPDTWIMDATSTYEEGTGLAAFGQDAVRLNGVVTARDRVQLGLNRFATASFYTKTDVAAPNSSVQLQLSFYAENGTKIASGVTVVGASDCTVVANGGDEIWTNVYVPDEVYTRRTCTFSTPSAAALADPVYGGTEHVYVDISFDGGADALIDGVQLEEGELASDYGESYSGTPTAVNLRVAPDYLGCTGDATDHPDCQNYAPICNATEVGCQLYTPVDGDPSVPGTVSANDFCPQECSGYETYRALETNFTDGDTFPVYFIADTAEQCTAQYAGCSEFTNLDTLAEGGEGREYYTDVRVCQEVAEAAVSNAGQATYYTWEGSDSQGYQLKTWTLKVTNQVSNNGAPCVNYDAASGNCQDVPAYTPPTTCDDHDDVLTNPDCREFYDVDGAIHYRLYSETVTVSDACNPYRKTVSTQADCTASNGVWNGASGECTYNILPSESVTCPASANACRGFAGNAGGNTRVVMQEFFEDGGLAKWDDTGSPASVYSNESVATDGRSLQVGDRIRTFVNSGTCSDPAGCIITNAQGASCTIPQGSGTQYCGTTVGQFTPGFSYILTLWAKGSGELSVSLEDGYAGLTAGGENASFVNGLELTTGWQQYTFGPLDPAAVNPDMDLATAVLLFEQAAGSTGTVFVDNVILREVEDTKYLIEGSWVTPASCDATPAGIEAPQFYLGCEEYRDSDNQSAYLRSFSSICREGAIGCEGFFDTQNSDSAYAQYFNLNCTFAAPPSSPQSCNFQGVSVCTVLPGQTDCQFTWEGQLDDLSTATLSLLSSNATISATDDTQVVRQDELVYLVDQPAYRCAEQAQACQVLGLPDFNIDNTVIEGYEEVALINDPDDYETILCDDDALFCEAFSATDGSLYYFKDPGEQTCEWRQRVSIGGSEFNGWFKTGTDEPCYGSFLENGTQYGIYRNGDGLYDGWVGTCPADQNQCSEFVDLADTQSGALPEGRSYYFLNNEKIDETNKPPAEKCEGQITQEGGCVGFNDTSVPFATFNTAASYIKSRYADLFVGGSTQRFDPVTPVSCPNGGEFTLPDGTVIDLCQQVCAYAGQGVAVGSYELTVGSSCYTNADCGTIEDGFGFDVQGSCVDVTGTLTEPGLCIGGDDNGVACTVDGDCTSGVCGNVAAELQAETGSPLLQNDANTILKVRRDRTCSEWLACDSQYTTWDSSRNQYVTICNSVSLCNEFDALAGGAQCASWPDEAQVVLDDTQYANRDVTWYGSEYSGYSIPDQYGVQHYDQIDINPARWCETSGNVISNINEVTVYDATSGAWSNGLPVSCTLNTDCQAISGDPVNTVCATADPDYRLGVAMGPCLPGASNGSVCQVGVCSSTGLSCATDSQCGTGETCNLTTSEARTGTCYNNVCAQTISGQSLAQSNARTNECRGYPEADAPFPNAVVTEWGYSSDNIASSRLAGAEDSEQITLQRRAGFDHANVCANGEACECTYKKVEFGNSTKTLYFEAESNAPSGVCQGGVFDGLSCNTDANCQAAYTGGEYVEAGSQDVDSAGTCVFQTSESTLVGWNGFCIERDGSINILGDQDQDACLLWLPVDQLVGSTDLLNKFTTAGYPINNQAYCIDTGLYVDLYTTNVERTEGPQGNIVGNACAESLTFPFGQCNGTGNDINDYQNCFENIECPTGYYGILGGCSDSALNGLGNAQTCEGNGSADNDCPYICVPSDSIATQDSGNFIEGQTCEPPTTQFDVQYGAGFPVYLVQQLSDVIENYAYCARKGLRQQDHNPNGASGSYANTTFYYPGSPGASSQGGQTHRNLINNHDWYLGCQELAFVSVEEGYGPSLNTVGNAAYTNRLLSPNQNEQFALDTPPDNDPAYAYTGGTDVEPAGRIVPTLAFVDDPVVPSEPEIRDTTGVDDYAPIPVAACYDDTTGRIYTAPASTNSCPTGTYVDDSNFARGFDYFEAELPGAAAASCTDDASCPANTATCQTSTFGCFLECTGYLSGMGHIPSSFDEDGDGYLDPSEGSAWCLSLNPDATSNDPSTTPDSLGACISDNTQSGFYCTQHYGPRETLANACDQAITDLGVSQTNRNEENTCVGAGGGRMCDADPDCYAQYCVDSECVSRTSGPSATNVPATIADEPTDEALTRLQQFFARIYRRWQFHDGQVTSAEAIESAQGNQESWPAGKSAEQVWWPDSVSGVDDLHRGTYVETPGTFGTQIDRRQVDDNLGFGPNDGEPEAPTVAAVTDQCIDGVCVEGVEGAFTLNGDDGNIFEAESNFLADLRFFAYTDPNQLPLRNVIVDWGDGVNTSWSGQDPSATWAAGSISGSTTDDNYYKARRGLFNTQQAVCVGNDDPDAEWGRTPDSCEEGPFQFQHNYRCTPGMLAFASNRTCQFADDGTNRLLNAPCTFSGAECVFQPRVHVRDNWGYCAGVCENPGDPTDTTCYGVEGAQECVYQANPRPSDPNTNPWVNYSGYVIVNP